MQFVKIFLSKSFRIPLIVFIGILIYVPINFLGFNLSAKIVIYPTIVLGSFGLIKETLRGIKSRQLALDYIAILAIILATFTDQLLVAAILALMIASGRTLEDYASTSAKKSLTGLIERIPHEVFLWIAGKQDTKEKVEKIKIGQEIFVRIGEVIPLDGVLVSDNGLTDESSLTGEPYLIEKMAGDNIRSGTVNIGNPMVIRVAKTSQNSTYNKIVQLVKSAQEEKSPLIRIADKYSNFFTLATLIIAAFAYIYSNFDLDRVLSVLAIATPCPLIIATPIALIGGVNSAAKRKIIIKRLAALETLTKVDTLVFDKTGTLTLGQPTLTEIRILDKKYTKDQILSIAEALERNSLHPLAKAIVNFAKKNKVKILHIEGVKEVTGKGISGVIDGVTFNLAKARESEGMNIELTTNGKKIALLKFEDRLKEDSKKIISRLEKIGLSLLIFTGDKKESAEKISKELGVNIETRAELKPEQKQEGIKQLQKSGKIVAMIGDGINDAPALALADVGLVFSHEEQTAASQAADIVFLGGEFSDVWNCLNISKRTISIAMQSILFGIGLSIAGMGLASVGFIPPIFGAGLQEAIDVAVIINALRTSI